MKNIKKQINEDVKKDILENPPKGTWFREEGDRIVVGASTRSSDNAFGFSIVFFVCLLLLFFSLYDQINKGEFILPASVLFILVFMGTVLILKMCLMAMFGKVELTIGENSSAFVGIGSLGWSRRFNWYDVENIVEEYYESWHKGNGIKLVCSDPVIFGNELSENRRLYLISVLKSLQLVRCPMCKNIMPVFQKKINDYSVICSQCKERFRVSENVYEDDKEQVVLKDYLRGTWIRKYEDKVIVGASTRSVMKSIENIFVFCVAFAMVVILALGQIKKGEILPLASLFCIPFIILSISFLKGSLMAILGKVELTIGKSSSVFVGIGRIGRTRRFNWDEVESIREESFEYKLSRKAIKLVCNDNLIFGNELNKERRLFLIRILNSLKKDRIKKIKIQCPNCIKMIPVYEDNIYKGFAFCPLCKERIRVSKNVYEDEEEKLVLKKPPRETWFRKYKNKTVVGASTRGEEALELAYGNIFILSLPFIGVFMTIFRNPVFIIHTIVFIILIIKTWGDRIEDIMSIMGKVEVNIGKKSSVFFGVGPFGKKYYFNWNDVTKILGSRIVLQGKKSINFNKGLNYKRQLYITAVLKSLLAERTGKSGNNTH